MSEVMSSAVEHESNLFTSECVGCGHPDKVADSISDAILDAAIKASEPDSDGKKDKGVRVACETLVCPNKVVLAGELSNTHSQLIDFEAAVRSTLRTIGYCDQRVPSFDADTVEILNFTVPQSEEINVGVDTEDGAGDQGLMFGYAQRPSPDFFAEDDTYMPESALLARRLISRHNEMQKSTPWLFSDCKSQVTLEYANDGITPIAVNSIVFATHHAPLREVFGANATLDTLKDWVADNIIRPVIPSGLIKGQSNTHLARYVNRSGSFEVGGPAADCGLTGRKIIVDTYAGVARHGGGAFSGKDPTKVDRSAAYAARYAAKLIVAQGMAERCEVQLSYAIGHPQPLSIKVETFGTNKESEKALIAYIRNAIDLSPRGIREHFGMWRPIYLDTALRGHFGRPELPWEQV